LNQIPEPFEPEELNVIATGVAAPASPRPQGPKQVVESYHLCYKTAIKKREKIRKLCASYKKPVCNEHFTTFLLFQNAMHVIFILLFYF